MPSPNDPLEPTPFDAAQPAPAHRASAMTPDLAAAPAVTPPAKTNWVLPALAGLLLLALLVIFWLPAQFAPDEPNSEQATIEQTGIQTQQNQNPVVSKNAPTTAEVSPWSDAQQAKLRKEAQDVLAELLDIQFALEERGVQAWAAERFAVVTTLAAQGDALYKSREYEAATALFQQGLTALQSIQASIPEQYQQLLTEAQQAIEAGDQLAAGKALDLAALIDPGDTELERLQQRAALLPELLTLLEAAATAESAGDLMASENLLRKATLLDTEHLKAQQELRRVSAAVLEQRFNTAMSEGYAALNENRFDSARKAFGGAAKLQPGSSEAGSALLEVEAAATAHRLAALNSKGLAYEKQERWQQAVNTYEQAQTIDNGVLFARDGLQRSRSRARLDQQFNEAIGQPGRLSDVGVAEAATVMLQQAKRITPRGTVLKNQIDTLEILLQQASTEISVTLQSDMETEVIVYKIARLGRFQQHTLTLRPGTYTAVGTRNGFRDVRQVITVRHDSGAMAVTVACTESI